MKKFKFLKVRKYLFFAVVLALLIGVAPLKTAEASEYITDYFDDHIFFADYKYLIYKDYGVGIHFPSMSATVHHIQGGTAKTVSLSHGLSLSISTAVHFNNTVGGSYGVDGVLEVTAQKDYGLTAGLGIEFSTLAGTTMYIESNYNSGYYRIEPAIDGYQYHYDKYKVKKGISEDNPSGSGTYYMTEGYFYYACMYSSNNYNWSDY